jgi:TonB family protein
VARVPPAGPAPGPPVPDMRTALRRGAGGTGLQGRGGIEGEPIRLDSEDPRYNDYLEQIRKRIQEKWGYPCIKSDRSCEYIETMLEIEFGILKDGRVQFVDVVRTSEYQIYDEYAATAIKLASPFPPVPQAMLNSVKPGSQGVPIRARFAYYIVKSSLTNLLR